MSEPSKDFAREQYTKVQDFVVNNKLYKNKPDSMSHSDILIELATSLQSQLDDANAENLRKDVHLFNMSNKVRYLTADRKDAIEALKMAMRLLYKAEMGNCMLYTPDINYLEQALTKLKTTKDE